MNKLTFAIILLIACISSCNNNTPVTETTVTINKDSAFGKVEIYDTAALVSIDSNATPELIGKNYTWSEGPVWVTEKQMLLFSDVVENKIYQWKSGDTPVVYLTPSGYTDTAKRDGENGSNGLALDRQGRLLLCQSGNRVVARMNAPLDKPAPNYTVLSSGYNGKKFNSPNDLVASKKDNIYFTDPVYGLPKQDDDPTRELPFEGIYKIDKAGKTTLLIDSVPKPNGVTLSLDEKILYVGSSDAKKPAWYAYNLDEDGNISGGGMLLDATEIKAKAKIKQGADGLKVDQRGNIFSAGPDGINIISPAGKLIGLIKVFDWKTSNCVFNETKDVLFFTADDLVFKVRLHN